MVGAGLLWGQVLSIRPTQTVFISTCLSLSSTPLVSRFVAGSSRGEREGMLLMQWSRTWATTTTSTNQQYYSTTIKTTCLLSLFVRVCVTGELDYSIVLLGMLVMQDVQLSLFIAAMPTLILAQSGDSDRWVWRLLYDCVLQWDTVVTLGFFFILNPSCDIIDTQPSRKKPDIVKKSVV